VHQTVGIASAEAIERVIAEREVRIVYQPIADLATRRIFAYEALARPTSTAFDGPLSLFAAAVEHGCTGALGRLLRELSVEGCADLPLFVNIHPDELNEGWLVQPHDPIFHHAPGVFLEITESVPLSHFALCQTIFNEVRGRGVSMVVDDLGAGFSNLKYIADLHPRFVKLDRVLVDGLTRGSRLFTVVSGIVEICVKLGARVVAEGIETPAELDAVIAAGAHYGQGYLLARPAFPLPSVTWPDGSTSPPVRRNRPTLRRLKTDGS
jgi:EAL domain-containing protein (putative c-di-GMP-specific phosphodiesterase class I)